MGAAQKQGTSTQIDIRHPQFNKSYLFTSPTEKALLVSLTSQEAIYKNWKEQVQHFLNKDISHQFLLIPLESNYTEGGICSTSGEVGIKYQYYPTLLATEMITRKQQFKRYSEAQLWYLLFAIVTAKTELAKDSFLVGDIHPNNIFLSDEKNIKVANMLSWPGESHNYKRALIEQKVTYLAPEDLYQLNLGSMDNNMNYQSELFSIGLVLLGCANLTFHEDLYFMETHQFQEDYFFLRLGKFQQETQYSQILRGIISNLLQIQPSKRLSLQDLQGFLMKHRQNILNRKALLIDNVPKRLQLTINNMIKAISNDRKDISNSLKGTNSPLQIQSIVQNVSSPKDSNQRSDNIGLNAIHQIMLKENKHQAILNLQKRIIVPQEDSFAKANNIENGSRARSRSRGPPTNTVNVGRGFQELVNSPKTAIHMMRDVKSLEHIVNHSANQIRMKSPSHVNHINSNNLNQPPRPNTQPPLNSLSQPRQQPINYHQHQQQQPYGLPPMNVQHKMPKIHFPGKPVEQQRPPNQFIAPKPGVQVHQVINNQMPMHQPVHYHQVPFTQAVNYQQVHVNQVLNHQAVHHQQISSGQQISNHHQKFVNNSNNGQKMDNNFVEQQQQPNRPNQQQQNRSNQQYCRPQQMKKMMQIRRSSVRASEQRKQIHNGADNSQATHQIHYHQPNLRGPQNQYEQLQNNKKFKPFANLPQASEAIKHTEVKESKQSTKQQIKMQQLIQNLQKQQYFDEQMRQMLINYQKMHGDKKQSHNRAHPHDQYNYQKDANVLKINSTITQRQYQNSTNKNQQSNHISIVSNSKTQIEALKSILSTSSKKHSHPIKIQQAHNQSIQHEEPLQVRKCLPDKQKIQGKFEQTEKDIKQRPQEIVKSQNILKLESTQQIKSHQASEQMITHLQINSKQKILIPQNRKQQQISKQQKELQFETKKAQMIESFKLELTKKYSSIEVVTISSGNDVSTSGKMSPLVKVWGMTNNQSNNKSNEASHQQGFTSVKQTVCLKAETDKDPGVLQKNKNIMEVKEEIARHDQGQNKKVFQQIKNILNKKQHNENDQNNILNDRNVDKEPTRTVVVVDSKLSSTQTIIKPQNRYHTYADLPSHSTFQQCWQEMTNALKDPSLYSTLIHAHKVSSTEHNGQKILKVGPATFAISMNEQQGKILLQSNSQSRCTGNMLCGIFKDDQKKHRIWVNSACFYKNEQFPSRQLIGDILFKLNYKLSEHAGNN